MSRSKSKVKVFEITNYSQIHKMMIMTIKLSMIYPPFLMEANPYGATKMIFMLLIVCPIHMFTRCKCLQIHRWGMSSFS